VTSNRSNNGLTSRPQTRHLIAASVAVLVPFAARGAQPDESLGSERATEARVQTPLLQNVSLSFSLQPEQKPAESQPAETPLEEPKPLTISTNRSSFTDTCVFVPIGHFQLETGYTYTLRDRDGVRTDTHNGPELLARVTLIEDRLEINLGTSGYVWSGSDDGTSTQSVSGFSDIVPGFRVKIIDEDGFMPRICFEAQTTVGLGSHDISTRKVEPVARLLWSHDLGHGLGICGSLGIAYPTTDGSHFIQGQGSVCLTWSATDTLSFFAEYYLLGPNTKDTHAAHYADFGVAYLLTNRVQLDARIGAGLNQEANNLFVGAGISFLF